jgi:hypothetical protein
MSPESGSREYGQFSNGFPRAYTNLGLNVELYPTPDDAYTIGINYYRKVTPLSAAVSTNNILQKFPDLYLFGSCLEGAIFLNDTEQMQRFILIFGQTLESVREAEESARYGGTVMTMTTQGDPGGMVARGAY